MNVFTKVSMRGMALMTIFTMVIGVVPPRVASAAVAPSCTIVSDSSTQVNESDSIEVDPNLLPDGWVTIDGAKWIWSDADFLNAPAGTQTFTQKFIVNGTSTGAQLTLLADNGYDVRVNGSIVYIDNSEFNYGLAASHNILSKLIMNAENTIEITVKNLEGSGNNPAGLAYKIEMAGNTCNSLPVNGFITVHKIIEGGEFSASDFGFFAQETESHTNVIEHAMFQNSGFKTVSVPVGTYDIRETDFPEGFDATDFDIDYSEGCSNFFAAAADPDEITAAVSDCTITNTFITDGGDGDKTLETIVVTGDTAAGENLPGWMFNRDASSDTPFAFNTSHLSIGSGSLEVFPISTTSADKMVAENFIKVAVADLDSIAYDFLVAGNGTTADANDFYLNVYANTVNDNKFYDCRFDYVPTVATVGTFSTATFNVTDTPVNVQQSGTARTTCPATLAEMPEGSYVRVFALNLGDASASDAGLAGNFDKVVVETASKITTYDFEPADVITPPVLVCSQTKTNLLANGSFETPTVDRTVGWNVFDSVVNGLSWVVSWINPSINAPTVAKLELQNGRAASDGSQYAELDSNYTMPGEAVILGDARVKIAQTVTTVPGQEYTLTYDFSAVPGHARAANNKVQVLIDGVVVDTQTTSLATGATTTNWTNQSFTFTATNTATEIALADAGRSNTFGTLIDNVSLTGCVLVEDNGGGSNDDDTYELFGFTWDDTDEDDSFDEGEPALVGWNVRAVNASNSEEVYTDTTDASGRYSINVPAGTWVISEQTESGWEQLSTADGDGTYTVTVPAVAETLTFLDVILPTAAAATLASEGPFDFGNNFTGSNGGGGGRRNNRNTTPSGEVLGAATSTPTGLVLGAATTTMPVGAPNTGAGGTAPVTIVIPTIVAILPTATRKSK